MWGSADEALKFKSSMADGETIYPARPVYRTDRRNSRNKKIERAIRQIFINRMLIHGPGRPLSYILTRHCFFNSRIIFPKVPLKKVELKHLRFVGP